MTALSLAAQTELQNRNPALCHRWEAFLELYDGTGKIKNLDAQLLEAFNVPEIPGATEDPSIKPDEDGKSPEKPELSTVNREDVAIQKWINGDGLHQTIATQLRPLIFAAVADAIDWDMLGLAKTAFVGRTGTPLPDEQHQFRPADYTDPGASPGQNKDSRQLA